MADLQSPKDRITLRNGYGIPCLGFGTWKMPDGEVGIDAVHQALHDGYRHIDTAAAYDNEGTVGKALASGGVSREDVFVTTKVWNTDRGYDATLKAFEESRAKLLQPRLRRSVPHPLARCEGGRSRLAAYEPGDVACARDALPRRARARHRREQLQAPSSRVASWMRPTSCRWSTRSSCIPAATRRLRATSATATTSWWRRGRRWARAACWRTSCPSTSRQLRLGTVAQLCLRWRSGHPPPKSTDPSRIAENARIFWFNITDEDLQRIDELIPGQSGLDPDAIDF